MLLEGSRSSDMRVRVWLPRQISSLTKRLLPFKTRSFVLVLLVALTFFSPLALAQNQPMAAAAASACGPSDTKFDVKSNKHTHPLSQPTEGKALVYFIQDDSLFASFPKPTTRAGLDGAWVGATHGNSYFYFSVDAGEHHLCASWQSEVVLGAGQKTAAAHFNAKAGDVLYFRVRNTWSREAVAAIDFAPVDSDEALLLMSTFSFSSSRPKPN